MISQVGPAQVFLSRQSDIEENERCDFVDGQRFISVRVLIMWACIVTQDKNAKLLEKIHIFAQIIHVAKSQSVPAMWNCK